MCFGSVWWWFAASSAAATAGVGGDGAGICDEEAALVVSLLFKRAALHPSGAVNCVVASTVVAGCCSTWFGVGSVAGAAGWCVRGVGGAGVYDVCGVTVETCCG